MAFSSDSGTCVKFNPPVGADTMMKSEAVLTNVSTKCQCITAMKEYESKSLEELRLEDYILKRKGGASVMHSTNATSQKGICASNSTTIFAPSNSITASSTSIAFSNSLTKRTQTTPLVAFQNPTPTAFQFPNPAITTNNSIFFNSTPTFSFPNLPSAFASPKTLDSSRRLQWVRAVNSKTQLEQPLLKNNTLQKKGPFVDAWTQTEKDLRVSKLFQGLKDMLLKSKHSDFILNVQGKEFKVHKIILEAHSPVFAAMLEHDTKEKATGVANINDFDPLTITNFLEFLYTGRVENLNSDNVIDLYEVADKYQVTELSDLCIEYMINNISVENFCDTLTLSLRHHIRNLADVAMQFFLQNSKEIAVTVKWGTFLAQNPVAGNELFLKALNLENK